MPPERAKKGNFLNFLPLKPCILHLEELLISLTVHLLDIVYKYQQVLNSSQLHYFPILSYVQSNDNLRLYTK